VHFFEGMPIMLINFEKCILKFLVSMHRFHVGFCLVNCTGYRSVNTICCNEDRKSTRLNSSHVSNSYAVFCLKKKRIVKKEIGRPYYLYKLTSKGQEAYPNHNDQLPSQSLEESKESEGEAADTRCVKTRQVRE